jgi:hypothetical protein
LTNFTFADRYAEAGLAPSPQIITLRQAPTERIISAIASDRILDLAGIYFDSAGHNLAWFRDEFAQEDASFSLINHERETRVLAAIILGKLVAEGNSTAILAILVGNVAGHRVPTEAGWLLRDAKDAFGRFSVTNRQPKQIEMKVQATPVAKLADEITAIGVNDWATLVAVLGKTRSEARGSADTMSKQATAALLALKSQMELLREESQMLWWLFGGHSRSLERSFGSFAPLQAAIVSGVDLGELTDVSPLGPVAASAMLERVIALAKRPKGAQLLDLSSAIDGFAAEDLKRLVIFPTKLPPKLAPVTAAIELARTIGTGAWQAQFRERTGLDVGVRFDPTLLAEQLYREHLLGQLI